jgi:hypothetical protein
MDNDKTFIRVLFFWGIATMVFIAWIVYAAVQEQKKAPPSEDLNRDGKVTIEDFSVGVYLLDNIMTELNKQGVSIN